jgi:SAM-dependent methyltransferase
MSHWQQRRFVSLVDQYFLQPRKRRLKVLEVGSYDVNGSVRELFRDCEYVGADLASGPGVDVVSHGHKLTFPDRFFDVTISCECFEHDEHWIETFKNMHRITTEDGMIVVTCASTGRLEHGTRRTSPESSPGTYGSDYYRNLTASDFSKAFDLQALFKAWECFFVPTSSDLYFLGWKGESQVDKQKFLSEVRSIGNVKTQSTAQAIFHLPITVASRVLPEKQFQDFALGYMKLTRPIRSLKETLK